MKYKRCPFCGSEKLKKKIVVGERDRIICKECGASAYKTRWNERYDPDIQHITKGLEHDLKVLRRIIKEGKREKPFRLNSDFIEAYYQADFIQFLLNEVFTGNIDRV